MNGFVLVDIQAAAHDWPGRVAEQSTMETTDVRKSKFLVWNRDRLSSLIRRFNGPRLCCSYLAEQFPQAGKVIGIDLSPHMVVAGRYMLAEEPVSRSAAAFAGCYRSTTTMGFIASKYVVKELWRPLPMVQWSVDRSTVETLVD